MSCGYTRDKRIFFFFSFPLEGANGMEAVFSSHNAFTSCTTKRANYRWFLYLFPFLFDITYTLHA